MSHEQAAGPAKHSPEGRHQGRKTLLAIVCGSLIGSSLVVDRSWR
ncbi:MAG TPA: hypothetical protein VFL85_05110 [Candidatus Saccharimonadales bacterium]|nr:hypothetical protein [Candidatus Saccharimonadales bacterium]